MLPFVAPVNQAEAAIQYEDRLYKLPSSLQALRQGSDTPRPTSTFTRTPTSTPTPTPTPTFTPAPVEKSDDSSVTYSLPLPSGAKSVLRAGTVSNQGVKFTFERVDFWDKLPDGTQPQNDIFVVFTGTLSEIADGTNSHCIGAEDVILFLGQQAYEMDHMRSANQFYQSDYPGYIVPQCIVGQKTVTTFFVFDVNLASGQVYLSLHKALLELDETMVGLASEANVLLTTTTITASAGNGTDNSPTLTSTPINTDTATSNGVVNRNANLRAGPGTSFAVVGNATAGDVVTVVGENNTGDWYQLETGNWIAAFLVDQQSSVRTITTPTANEEAIVAIYVDGVVSIANTYGSAFDQIGDLFTAAGSTPTLILTDDWKIQVAVQLALLQAAGNDVRNLQAPPSMQPVQEAFLKAARYYDSATVLIAEGIDDLDAQKLSQAIEQMEAGNQAIDTASSLAKQFSGN